MAYDLFKCSIFRALVQCFKIKLSSFHFRNNLQSALMHYEGFAGNRVSGNAELKNNDAKCKHIDAFVVVSISQANFNRHVGVCSWVTCKGVQFPGQTNSLCHTKVSNLSFTTLAKKDIFGSKVSMHNRL